MSQTTDLHSATENLWSGERYMPGMGGRIAAEHHVRYAWAQKYVSGKKVLDVASGEGYGSRMLAKYAISVCGVDVSRGAVAHATARYEAVDNLEFKTGNILSLPLADVSVDVVTCFETLEHVADPEGALAEIRRVLKPDGMLFISTPNKSIYSDRHQYANPFHVREFDIGEFRDLLRKEFVFVNIYWQISTSISAIGTALPERDAEEVAATMTANAFSTYPEHVIDQTKISPLYYIAACGSAPLSDIQGGVKFLDLADTTSVDDEMALRAEMQTLQIETQTLREEAKKLHANAENVQAETDALRLESDKKDQEISLLKDILGGLQEQHRLLWEKIKTSNDRFSTIRQRDDIGEHLLPTSETPRISHGPFRSKSGKPLSQRIKAEFRRFYRRRILAKFDKSSSDRET